MNISAEITTILKEAVSAAGFSDTKIVLDHPQDMTMGDYATPVALALAKQAGKNPREVAESIVEQIEEHKWIENVEIAGPGFINFYLSKQFFVDSLDTISTSNSWGNNDNLAGKKWLVEHTQPNLFKPFHIGHLVNNAMGNSLSQIFRASGADILELSFPSDVSPGIAKAVWALMEKGWDKDLKIEQIGEAYAYGSQQYDVSESIKERINEINKMLYERTESPELEVYDRGVAFSLDYFKKMVSELGTTFDGIILETESEVKGKEIVKNHVGDVFEESQGAIIFRGSEHGLFDNVFINSAGFGTYLAKDIGLIWHKFDRYAPFDKSVYVTDMEQKQHFQLVAKSAELINPEWGDKSLFLQHGRLSLTSGKISSRFGNVPLAEDLIAKVEERVKEKMSDRDIDDDDKAQIARAVAIGALRYSLLKASSGKNIVFDFEKDLAFEGNTGPYLQYTYVRTQSILEKADAIQGSTLNSLENVTDLDKLIYRFPEVVEKSLDDMSPHHIATYLHELASAFNAFYANTKILDSENPDYLHNLALTQAVGKTIKNGLHLLGIETVDKM